MACSDSADIDNGMLVCLQVSLNLKCAASQDHPILLLCLSVLQPANADLCMHWLLKLYAQEYDSFARVWLSCVGLSQLGSSSVGTNVHQQRYFFRTMF